MAKFGLSKQEWNLAKQEIKGILIDRAKVRGMIPYSALVKNVQSIQLEAHDTRLFFYLGKSLQKKMLKAGGCFL